MTYEEKLELILQAISEAKKFTRKGYFTKLYCTRDNGLKDINLNEIYDILLKLQDEEKVIKIKEIPSELKSKLTFDMDKIEYFQVDAPEEFTIWYEAHIFENIHNIENIDWVNLLKVYDVALDINQQLQIASSREVYISALPQMVKFPLLFPQDDIGTRRTYQGYRIEGVDFLNKRGGVVEYKYIDTMDGGYGEIRVVVNLLEFREFFIKIGNEYVRRLEMQKKTQKEHKEEKPIKKMSENPPQEETNTSQTKTMPSISYIDGILEIGSKKVKFKKESFRAKLLELLLKDDKSRKKEWSWDEAIETIESTKGKEATTENKKKFYPACDGLTKHIASKIGVNDLLIFNKSTVQINPKYL